MKTYIQPTTNVVKIQYVSIICESLGLKGASASVDGSNNYDKALGRQDNSWDIWGTGDYDEE